MLIRYHCFYYAVACMLIALGKYFHFLFYFILILYLVWLKNRLTYRHVLFCIGLCICLYVFPHSFKQQTLTNVEGQVIKVYDKYCYLQTNDGIIKLYHDDDLRYRDTLQVKIEYMKMNRSTNDNAFDEQLYLYGQNVFSKAKLIHVYKQEHHFSFYHFLENRLSSNENISSYQRLLLFGEKNGNILEDYELLSQFSLVHLFALSGMHLHILYIVLFSAISLVIYDRYAKIIVYFLLGFYVFSIPMQISLYRAFFSLVGYDLLKKYMNELDILSILIIISLFYNPYLIYNISFVFSYSIYFIVLITKHMKHAYIFIFLFSLAIILNINYQFPIFSFLLTSFLSPFIEILYSLVCISVFSPLGVLLLEYAVILLQKIIHFLENIQIYFSFSKPSLLFMILYYGILTMIFYKKSLRQKISRYVSMLIALLLAFSLYSQYKIYDEITMIDVGQGDCVLIRLAFNQGNILIDTGGQKDYDLATKTIIPYLKSIGVHSLDYVYISHDDFDHCGALDSLIEHFPVKNVVREYEEYREIGHMKVKMLNHQYHSDTNDQSLVMLVELNGYSVLFTGDISSKVEKELKEKYDIHVDILKVSHHGSATASSVDLFEWIQPDIAMIGVKKNNMYHHPSDTVIERLKRKNITILRTDLHGMFHIRFYPYSRYVIFTKRY